MTTQCVVVAVLMVPNGGTSNESNRRTSASLNRRADLISNGERDEMNVESIRLRQLADALEYLDALTGFDYQVRGDEIRVEWTTGGACVGYKEMTKAIARVVSERYEGLRLEAITAAEKRVAELRAELESSQGKRADEVKP
jgi:hypothetical protein